MDPITLWDSLYVGFHLPTTPIKPAVIFDLGANVGYSGVSFALRYPTSRIIAVEMDADNAALCRKNLSQFGDRCMVINAAIWSSSGTIQYGGKNVHDFAIGTGQQTAPAMTIDEVMHRCNISKVDYLKMDIEGAEDSVLTACQSWAPRVQALSVEVHPPATMEGCWSILTAAGFACTTHPVHHASIVAHRPAPGR